MECLKSFPRRFFQSVGGGGGGGVVNSILSASKKKACNTEIWHLSDMFSFVGGNSFFSPEI